jgi:hypothetical protein
VAGCCRRTVGAKLLNFVIDGPHTSWGHALVQKNIFLVPNLCLPKDAHTWNIYHIVSDPN